jgi:hypothetical protein
VRFFFFKWNDSSLLVRLDWNPESGLTVLFSSSNICCAFRNDEFDIQYFSMVENEQHDLCVSFEMCPQSWQHNLCVKWTSYLCVCTFENAGQNIVYLTDIICKYIEISVDDNFIPVLEMKTWINWSKSNFWIYFIYIIYLNKNWKIYWYFNLKCHGNG